MSAQNLAQLIRPAEVPEHDHPILHALVYGDPGGGKTHFAATWPKPLLYLNFDAIGKETPILKLGTPTTRHDNIRQVLGDDGSLLAQIEYFHDSIVTQPQAYERFMTRLASLNKDLKGFATLVLDSVTAMELAARKQQQYKINPSTKDPRQWYAGTTERLEEVLCIWLGSLHAINVVVCAHIDEDKDELHGTFVRNPSAPGRLRKRLAAYYSEMYRAHVVRKDPTAPAKFQLQTRTNHMYHATSVVAEAPDPCEASYEALWAK